MPQRSRVLTLPAAVRKRLEAAIVARGFAGYADLAEALEREGHAISAKSLQRHGARLARRMERVRLASEQARALVAAAPDDPVAVADASLRLVQERLFELMLAADGDSLRDLAAAARALAETARAGATVRDERRKALDEAARAKAEAARAADPEAERRLSIEAVRRIREQVYGLNGDPPE